MLANVLSRECSIWLFPEEDGGFVVKCPDIPGCVSQGDTREEALANIHEAISLCLEVIRDDFRTYRDSQAPEGVEVIERHMSEFLDHA